MGIVSIEDLDEGRLRRMLLLLNRADPLVEATVADGVATFVADMPDAELELRVWTAYEASDWGPLR